MKNYNEQAIEVFRCFLKNQKLIVLKIKPLPKGEAYKAPTSREMKLNLLQEIISAINYRYFDTDECLALIRNLVFQAMRDMF